MKKNLRWYMVTFLIARMVFLLTITIEGLRGYGDFWHFYELGNLSGLPFIHYWVEFPPLMPFIFKLLASISADRQHVFDYLLFIILTCVDMGNIWAFLKLAQKLPAQKEKPFIKYWVLLLVCAYGWWFFDPIAVFFMLLGLYLLEEKKIVWSGVVIGAGILTKLFPALLLVVVWKRLPLKKALLLTCITLLIVVGVLGVLLVISPEMTIASITAQNNKGSWETVWALIDGNFRTGNFGPVETRMDASMSSIAMGNTSVISPWITLVIFAAFGFWRWIKSKPATSQDAYRLLLFTFCLFFLWSPGWSPQWVLFLIPLIWLGLDGKEADLFAIVMLLVNLLEWPVMLSRGRFDVLPLTIGLRTLLLVMIVLVSDPAGKRKPVASGRDIPAFSDELE